MRKRGNEVGNSHAGSNTDRPTEETQRDGFDKELHQNIAAARAHGHADANFPGALGHAHQHDVHNADAANDERHGSHAGEQSTHYTLGSRGRLRNVFLVAGDGGETQRNVVSPGSARIW